MKQRKLINWADYPTPEARLKALNENPDAMANELLESGQSIVYRTPELPSGYFIREYPDGRKILYRRSDKH
ncbi:hypothetical protein [Xenorhabdus anantnagensis]|uniref:Uncharacterized protein n=1 Tax=Xenorhabdus anantnagensis TaxID=3025875 RepID=A0ABT5M015_9GAMM|nr:hypothetical protein [Xenorhabdus anantnagensis]MDC9598610.1 hypothetical protein [Xenorhabdus anantnagensis]